MTTMSLVLMMGGYPMGQSADGQVLIVTLFGRNLFFTAAGEYIAG